MQHQYSRRLLYISYVTNEQVVPAVTIWRAVRRELPKRNVLVEATRFVQLVGADSAR